MRGHDDHVAAAIRGGHDDARGRLADAHITGYVEVRLRILELVGDPAQVRVCVALGTVFLLVQVGEHASRFIAFDMIGWRHDAHEHQLAS